MTLRVKLEIVPFGDEDKAYEIGRIDIFNKGPSSDASCHQYGVIDLTKNAEGIFTDVAYHERKRGAWALVRTVLEDFDVGTHD